jgi:hypothetical protein
MSLPSTLEMKLRLEVRLQPKDPKVLEKAVPAVQKEIRGVEVLVQ